MLAVPAPMSTAAQLCLPGDPSHSIDWHAVLVDAYQSLGARPGLQNPAYISSTFRDSLRRAHRSGMERAMAAATDDERLAVRHLPVCRQERKMEN